MIGLGPHTMTVADWVFIATPPGWADRPGRPRRLVGRAADAGGAAMNDNGYGLWFLVVFRFLPHLHAPPPPLAGSR